MRAKIEDGVVYSPFRAADMPCCSFYAAAKEALHDEPDKLALADGSVSLTRRGLFALMRAYGAGFQKYGVKPGDRMCVHLGNSVRNFGAMWGCVFAGASVVLAKTSLTARELHYQLNDSDSTHILTEDTFAEKSLSAASSLQLKVTAITLLPAHLRAIVAEMQNTGNQLKGVRRIGIGGSALPEALYRDVRSTFCDFECLVNGYALTESMGILCSPSIHAATGMDVGFPAPSSKIKVVDIVTRRKLGPNEVGEICFQIPTLFKEYYKRPKETTELFEEGAWCRSGMTPGISLN